MATIGKWFADAGLRDLCVEAGVIADGSISGVIDGHRYNRAVRLHKLLYEAFLRLAWTSMERFSSMVRTESSGKSYSLGSNSGSSRQPV